MKKAYEINVKTDTLESLILVENEKKKKLEDEYNSKREELEKHINDKIIRQIFILLLILLMGGLMFKEMIPYLSGVLGAVIMYVLLKKIMTRLVKKGWHPNVAVAVLMLMSFLVILLPVTGIIMMLGNKIGSAVNNSEKVVKVIEVKLDDFESRFGYDLASQLDAKAISSWLSENLQGLAGGTFTTFIAISIMYFLLYYMLTNRKKLRESLFEYIPVSESSLKIIGIETRQMVRANALGIPLVAVAQGIVALIGFLIFGVQNPLFWSVIVTFGSMIPFVVLVVLAYLMYRYNKKRNQ